ncbi:hypothetical protein FSP39_006994, partial [Pinctada imbricata]
WNDRLPTPRFLTVPHNVTYAQGDSAILFCAVENLGTKTVTWRKLPYINPIVSGNRVFVNDERFDSQYVPFKNEWNLVIQNVRKFDAGVYECQVSIKGQTLRQNVTLNVQEIRINGTRFVEKGDPIYLVCNATGEDYAPDYIEWYKDGDLMYTDPRRRVYIKKRMSENTKTLISILKITHSLMTDSGTFVCRTSNKLTTGIKVEVLNGIFNNTSRTETLSTKDTAMFLQSTAGTICCLALIQYFVKYFLIHNPWHP